MTVRRLITFMTALLDYCVRELPQAERHQLARECLRLLKAALPPEPMPPVEGVLARLRQGERSE